MADSDEMVKMGRAMPNKADTQIDGVGNGDGQARPDGVTSAEAPRREADESGENAGSGGPGSGKSMLQEMYGGLGYGDAKSKSTKMGALNL